MSPRRRRFAIVLIVAGLTVAILCALALRTLQRRSALDAVTTWARLAPLPETARDVQVSTRGSMFSRDFHVTFSASPAEVAAWLQASPGTREATPMTPSPGVRHHRITPGGGAEGAEVEVENDTRSTIRA